MSDSEQPQQLEEVEQTDQAPAHDSEDDDFKAQTEQTPAQQQTPIEEHPTGFGGAATEEKEDLDFGGSLEQQM